MTTKSRRKFDANDATTFLLVAALGGGLGLGGGMVSRLSPKIATAQTSPVSVSATNASVKAASAPAVKLHVANPAPISVAAAPVTQPAPSAPRLRITNVNAQAPIARSRVS